MNDLVFLEPNKLGAVPFTTSEVIAEISGVGRKKIKLAIQKNRASLEVFGKVVPYETTLASGQVMTGYRLNEEQATFLMTLLKNTTTVVAFKVELVRQFYAMRKELSRRAIAQAQNVPKRRNVTDGIRDLIPDSPHKNWKYKQYTDLAYKAALGKYAVQLRKDKGAPKRANLAEYLNAEESEAVGKMLDLIYSLMKVGMDYLEIKAILLDRLRIAV